MTGYMAPFYGCGFYGLFMVTTKFPEIPGTHMTNLGRMAG